MSWNLKGRAAIAALDPPTRYRVLHSHTMTRCANKPLLWVLEELTTLRSLGGLVGPLHTADYFICLVARLLQIAPPVAIVRVMLDQDVHKYLRAAALLIVRLIGHAELQREAMRVGWLDYRKLCLYGSDPAQEWADSTTAGGDGATDTPGTLSSAMRPLDHHQKRPRESADADNGGGGNNNDDVVRAGEVEVGGAHAPQPPRYMLIRMDEFVDYVFGVAPAPRQSEHGTVTDASSRPAPPSTSRALPPHTFMGIHFPALYL
ncbi:Pre-mRNA-splicing factor 38 [Novymonas esmeraldas]|uniref:Pre-mRNA-splicing factor 38 n=1 Tax=Novymonas esmeraldas TaxID=1808958 RepID=A0AAW0EQV9_9TRYP